MENQNRKRQRLIQIGNLYLPDDVYSSQAPLLSAASSRNQDSVDVNKDSSLGVSPASVDKSKLISNSDNSDLSISSNNGPLIPDLPISSLSSAKQAKLNIDQQQLMDENQNNPIIRDDLTKNDYEQSLEENSDPKILRMKELQAYFEEYKPPEPSYSKANALPFSTLCKRFEKVWRERMKRCNKQSKDTLLDYLLPKSLRKYLGEGSLFPLLRLMVPDRDTMRPHSGMKEKTIAKAWGDALALSKTSSDYKKLMNFYDPILAGPSACGDLSIAISEVIEKRFVSQQTNINSITIGKMNQLLDDLANVKKPNTRTDCPTTTTESSTGKSTAKHQMRMNWVGQLIKLNLSALEHKWVVRILLQRLEIGVGSDSIIKYCDQRSGGIYSANKNIKSLCSILCDSDYLQKREEYSKLEESQRDSENRQMHMPRSEEHVSLGSTIAPMLSMKTSFRTFLTDIQRRHKAFLDTLPRENPLRSSLSLRYPTFICEVKLDGERILAHIKRGTVKMQTRNSVWYSNLYSPILGPALRQAIEGYDVDVIFDGEVISWDDGRKDTIPFGSNRTVAKARKDWCMQRNLLDERDLNVHKNESDGVNVLKVTDELNNTSFHEDEFQPGKECWLKYVVFDILYVDGPDARKLIHKACWYLNEQSKPSVTGSILDLDLYQRKSILHTLLNVQENVVEHVDSMVIRSDGTLCDGKEYFSENSPKEYGYSRLALDSISCTLNGDISDLQIIDSRRRKKKSYLEIDKERAICLDSFYSEIVSRRCLEGLVMKDLDSPYGLGTRFRNIGYWFKLKDDYEKLGHAADIDVLVLGASFATGMKRAGLLNQFLVGCVDNEISDGHKYLTLCNVNGGGMSFDNLKKILAATGFNTTDKSTTDFGNWFKGNGQSLPDFISTRSFQRNMNSDSIGWKFKRMHYPDLWIRPKDSFIFTINAGEIVSSQDYSAGVTLRFPRITRIRARGFQDGPKAPEEVESVTDLQQTYLKRRSQQCENESHILSSYSVLSRNHAENCKFVTAANNLTSKRRSKSKTLQNPQANSQVNFLTNSNVVSIISSLLKGFTCTVLEGNYYIDSDSIDAEEAKKQGWFDQVEKVKCRKDVITFILSHSGKCELTGSKDTNFIIGGQVNDARVQIYLRAAHAAVSSNLKKVTKRTEHLQKMVDLKGILKWTYFFSYVHKMSKEKEENENMSNMLAFCEPAMKDYLVLPRTRNSHVIIADNVYGLEIGKETNLAKFKRALEEISLDKEKNEFNCVVPRNMHFDIKKIDQFNVEVDKEDYVPWQYQLEKIHAINGNLPLSLTRMETSNPMPIILYPDLFTSDGMFLPPKAKYLGLSSSLWNYVSVDKKLSEIASTLPLAKAMGARITTCLNSETTHILCELKSLDIIQWNPHMSCCVFFDAKRGEEILKQASRINADLESDHKVYLVTPAWLRNRWNVHISSKKNTRLR